MWQWLKFVQIHFSCFLFLFCFHVNRHTSLEASFPVEKNKRQIHLWEITIPPLLFLCPFQRSRICWLMPLEYSRVRCCGPGLSPAEKNKALDCSSKIESLTVSLYIAVPHTPLAIIATQKNEAQARSPLLRSLFTYFGCLYHQCWCSRTEIQAVSDRSTWNELTNPFAGWNERENTLVKASVTVCWDTFVKWYILLRM